MPATTTARVVWMRTQEGTVQAFVLHAGRILRMVYDATRRVLAIAFADVSAQCKLQADSRPPVNLADVMYIRALKGYPTPNIVQRFLQRSLEFFTRIGVL